MKNLPIATVCDLQNLFDSVGQTLLLSKLINCGLNGPMLATIKTFLSNQKSSIQVNDFIDMSFVLLMVYLRVLYCHHFCLYFI